MFTIIFLSTPENLIKERAVPGHSVRVGEKSLVCEAGKGDGRHRLGRTERRRARSKRSADAAHAADVTDGRIGR